MPRISSQCRSDMKIRQVALRVMKVARVGRDSFSSIGAPRALLSPIFIDAAVIMVSSAWKNSRPSRPTVAPIASSPTMSPASAPRSGMTKALPPVSCGASARVEGERDEQARARRQTRAGKARRDHQAAADPAEQDENRRDHFRRQEIHDTVPSDLISTPRASSRCDSTGRVANRRSTIMRT